MQFRRRIMLKRRDQADISNVSHQASKRKTWKSRPCRWCERCLSRTDSASTFILHNLHAVIRLSLRNRPFIIQGGRALLGIGNNHIMEATTVLFQSEVEKKSPVKVGSGMRIPITIGPLVA